MERISLSLIATLSETALEWLNQIRRHATLGWWMLGVSLVLSVGGIFLMRWLLVAMPADFFVRSGPLPWELQHPVMRWSLIIGKNLLGAILLLLGVILLFAPGPGALTILAGIVLLDFPGKRHLEQRLLALPAVLHTINCIRQRAKRPPLEMPHH